MIISTKEIIKSTGQVPYYNEVGFFPSDEYSATQPYDYAALINLVLKTPEAIGILHAIQVDICSDGYTFEGFRRNIELAEEFCRKNRFKTEFGATVFDWLLFGNGALWKGRLTKTKLKEAMAKIQALTKIEIKEAELKLLVDEESTKTRLLKSAPWSTMNIELDKDKRSISGYHQTISDNSVQVFTPDEIIHGKFMQFDGRVYGFSPMQASVNILSTLALIKDLNGSFFSNGGVPDWMFILPKEMAGSPNVKKLEQLLQKYKSSRNKHGNLVFTGEINPVQMNRFDKDMEFRQLAVYYTGILALAFNMPLARVSAILSSEVKAGTADTDLSDAGYWRSISSAQDYWEDLLNDQLFEPEFKVKIRFNRGYKNDEIKEAQRDVQAFEVLNKLYQAGSITPDYIKYKLHIPDRFWTGKFEAVQPQSGFGSSQFGSPGSSPKNDLQGDAKQQDNSRKEKLAKDAQSRR